MLHWITCETTRFCGFYQETLILGLCAERKSEWRLGKMEEGASIIAKKVISKWKSNLPVLKAFRLLLATPLTLLCLPPHPVTFLGSLPLPFCLSFRASRHFSALAATDPCPQGPILHPTSLSKFCSYMFPKQRWFSPSENLMPLVK